MQDEPGAHLSRRSRSSGSVRRPVGRRLRILLVVVTILVSVLGANSLYLAGITAMEEATGQPYENYFYQYMFLLHVVLGLALVVPLLAFIVIHRRNVRSWRSVPVVQLGNALAITCLVLLASGFLLVRVAPLEIRSPGLRTVAYWLHVSSPIVALWLLWLHRLAGPPIRWPIGGAYTLILLLLCGATLGFHRADPRAENVVDASSADRLFPPSLARSTSHLPARSLMNDDYCRECHADVHAGWSESVHHFSSFNNPVYLASVRQTEEHSQQRDGNRNRIRWCAGCHDPVPLLTGRLDQPDFDDVRDPTASAGITCTVCHAITQVNSTRGNADYTIEEPLHYPFAYSKNRVLGWVNRQLVKAKPSFHKRTFLKPHHRTAEFCSVCHKVHLPEEVNDYKFLRGQNHYDPYLLSGVSGHGARSFYYPDVAQINCNGCHMRLIPSDDFGAAYFDGASELSVHDHLFPSANTAIAYLRDRPEVVAAHQEFLDGVMRVDVFGIREGGQIDGRLVAPLRPEVPVLQPGGTYLLEVVIRTVKMGHLFTQGTTDSNQIWLQLEATSGGRVIGRSGGLDARRRVDPWSHFVNTYMLDRHGRRIERRNAQDIFVPLYSNQIPPGAGQTVHYSLELPEGLTEPVEVTVRLLYRKFDVALMDFVTESARPGDAPIRDHQPGQAYMNRLPITTLATDRIAFGVEGQPRRPSNPDSPIPLWQRWNDYGIGLLLKGTGQLRQSAEAFAAVERLGRYDGPLNLARVYYREGRLDDAVTALRRAMAEEMDPAPPSWTVAWLSGLINRQQGNLEAAEESLRKVLQLHTDETVRRRFDFSLDYQVSNLLGETLFDRARRIRGNDRADEREALLREAVEQFRHTLAIDAENVTAHHGLSLLLGRLGDEQGAARHRQLHAKYKPDDNARDKAFAAARRANPAADHAAENVVIYSLRREDTSDADHATPKSSETGPGDSR